MKSRLEQRIAILIPSLRGGGAERAMVSLANGIVGQGYTVDLVLAEAVGVFEKEVSDKVRIVDLGSHRMLASIPKLVAYLHKTKPDALLSAMSHVNLMAIWAHRLAGAKSRIVISERSTFTQAMNGLKGRGTAAWLIPKLVRISYPMADAVVSVSEGVHNDLLQHVQLRPEHAHVIYNPIVDESLSDRASEPLEHPWFQPGEPSVILAVGRLTEAKNYPLLIKAFARLQTQRSCRLLIIGEGPLRNSLQALVQELGLADHVSMPGFAENPFPFMRLASVFVLSSSWEGLPGALIQAMACGCRVVSTNCPSGPAEILENGKWGALVPVDDEAALAAAILDSLNDPHPPDVRLRAQFFSVDHAVQAYLDCLRLARASCP